MPRLTDPSFVYVPSHRTNIRETFARIRAEREASTAPADGLRDYPQTFPIPSAPYWFRQPGGWRDIDTRR